jgi:hypothetical protein
MCCAVKIIKEGAKTHVKHFEVYFKVQPHVEQFHKHNDVRCFT